VFRGQALTDRPMSGFERPGLTAYANLVRRFMVEQGIPAGVLAVSKRDQLVVSRGIGWKDKAMTTTIEPNAVVRLMSVDKAITLAAIRRIIDAGTFDPASNRTITDDTPIFPVLAAHGLTPPPGVSVPSLVNQITIRHLIDHVGGLPGVPWPPDLYAAFGITAAQSNLTHNVRWMYGAGPEFVPGSCPHVEGCYSSSGYMVLRYLVHVLKGDLITYLRNVVLAPVGTNEVFLSYERLENRLPSEPGYMTFVEPYDRWVFLENYTALSATAPALVKFARGYHLPTGARLINPATGGWSHPENDNGTYVAAGGGEGLVSWVIQRLSDEVNIAIVFPLAGGFTPHPEATTPSVDIVRDLDELTNTIPESAWN
jgi:CubicO group peptidase (beta-lactamase class C family)